MPASRAIPPTAAAMYRGANGGPDVAWFVAAELTNELGAQYPVTLFEELNTGAGFSFYLCGCPTRFRWSRSAGACCC